MPERRSLHALAPAKINLTLEILGKREDGYHELRSILQTLALADEVTLTLDPAPGADHDISVAVFGPFADGTPADSTNLACRAAQQLADITGNTSRMHVALEKRIPAAGGLGGGASDAATVLRLLQHAWPDTTDDQLLEAANRIGSDEAAFVLGGTVEISGRGEIVRSLPALAPHDVVLFIPKETIPAKTGRMFAAVDQSSPFDDGSVTAALIRQMPCSIAGLDIYNGFERVVYDLFPALAGLWEQLESRVGSPIHLAGAGPALFWIGQSGRAETVAALAGDVPCTVVKTRTADSLWRR